MNFISRYFKIEEAGSNIQTEILAGFTTFLTMAYIIFVNPNILSTTGMPFGAVMVATCLSASIASFLMGVYAKLPVALAPGMGINAYFAFSVCGAMGIPWQTALGAVFISGVLFFILSVTGLREKIIVAIPDSMKHAVAAGIGIFIAFVGLQQAGIIVKNDNLIVSLGNMKSVNVLISISGLVICGVFLAWKIRGALLWSILITSIIAMFFGVAKIPASIISMPPSLKSTFMAMDVKSAFSLGLIDLIFTFFFVDVFDTLATLISVGSEGGLLRKNEKGILYLPNAGKAFASDSIGTMVGAVTGTSTVTSYIESTAGIASGGRTGLVPVIVSIMFLLALFFSPIVGVVPAVATAPVLIVVCMFMIKAVTKVKWDDYTESLPAVVACIGIPLTFSISNGLALGFITYSLIKLISGRGKDVHPLMYIFTALFVIKFIWLSR